MSAVTGVGSSTTSSTTGLTNSSSTLNFTGLATGIDTNKIITSLNQFTQQKIDSLNSKKSDIVSEQTTFATLQADLYDLQSKSNTLARSVGGAFDGRTATVSDTTALTATAGSSAVAGTYTVSVNHLAAAQQIASAGYIDPNTQLRTGTLSLQVGSGAVTTVTLTSQNNTLQGLANAINTAGGDVQASIISDGSANPYRLLLTSTKTGAANTITVTNHLTGGSGASIDPTSTTVQAAADASVSLGTLTVTSPSNQINNLINGVTLNLAKSGGGAVNITVANDTAAATTALQNFVTSYNSVVKFIGSQTQYDATTNTAGQLLGNPDVSALSNALANALGASVPGAGGLSSVGLSFNSDGTLALNTNQLASALNSSDPNAIANIKKLFALSGSSNNPGVSFILGGANTKPTVGTSYQVQVTAPATQALVTATSLPVTSGGPPAVITISPPNNTLLFQLNGLAARGITVNSGFYTPDQVAALLQQQINVGASPGNLVAVSVNNSGHIQITSQQYGSTSQISFAGSDTSPQSLLAQLGFTGSETATGTDVKGSFVANGKTEAATGNGQTLSGNAGNANTDGLAVQATLTAPGTANLTVNSGVASQLNQVLNGFLDPTNGRLKTINDGFTQQTTDINKQITQANTVLATNTAQLQAQFSAMETAVNNLKSIQTQLSTLVSPTITTTGPTSLAGAL